MNNKENKERLHIPKRLTLREQLWIENFHGHEIPSSLKLADEYLQLINPGSLVGDGGSGYGRVSNFLADTRGAIVIGYDINPSGVEFARKNCPNPKVSFEVMDATLTEFSDNTFDHWEGLGLLGGVELEERKAILADVYRIVKPGGAIAVAEFKMNLDDNEQIEKYKRDKDITGEWGSRIVRKGDKILFIGRHFTKEELIQLLSDAGFVNIQSKEQVIESAGIGDGQMKVRMQNTVWGFKPSEPEAKN